MLIQVNTDRNIQADADMTARVQEAVANALRRFGDRVTRVEVHLSDENSHKGGENDHRCVIEVRLAGRRPTAVTHQAASMDQALTGATDKIKAALDSTIGRLQDS